MEPKVSKHGMLRDNICWEDNWLQLWWLKENGQIQMTIGSSMGVLGLSCQEQVRGSVPETLAQMVRHIGVHGTKSFVELVEILSKRYCPSLLKVRDAWDKKSPID
ncbi:hypothetical protein CRG98_013321 [Punica granatum]|uniref:Uncharacterized protein n=1 Tax=Punica granatum TaxID=22663 RepID=A0A2I0KCN2_PUNGR|nr:hypothetical protein CRG98_013321 [Punica granatum]